MEMQEGQFQSPFVENCEYNGTPSTFLMAASLPTDAYWFLSLFPVAVIPLTCSVYAAYWFPVEYASGEKSTCIQINHPS